MKEKRQKQNNRETGNKIKTKKWRQNKTKQRKNKNETIKKVETRVNIKRKS